MNLTEERYRLWKTICKVVCQKHEDLIRAFRLGWWITCIAQGISKLY